MTRLDELKQELQALLDTQVLIKEELLAIEIDIEDVKTEIEQEIRLNCKI